MAKSTKKPKPIKVRTPMDPETKRMIRRFTLHFCGVICLTVLCGVGLFYMRRHVEQKLTYPAAPPKVVLVNRPDLPWVGAGETPIIPVAPAIANALFQASGQRIRQMPIRLV